MSNRKHKVFIDDKGAPTVAFTGSRTAGDWITNGALLLGLAGKTDRFRDSKKLVDNFRKKYNTKSIYLSILLNFCLFDGLLLISYFVIISHSYYF